MTLLVLLTKEEKDRERRGQIVSSTFVSWGWWYTVKKKG